MTKLYLDTSIVVALFVEEERSRNIRNFLRAERKAFLSSDFLRLEFASAIGRRVRTGMVGDAMARQALFFCDQWIVSSTEHLALEARDIEAARSMLTSGFDVNLRVPDALHLAIAARSGSIFTTHDQRLLNAATEFGIAVASP